MKTLALLYTFVILVACSNVTFAQHGTSGEHTTLSQVEDHYINGAEHALVPIAEAMPEDKYSFAPTNGQFKGVRTFAEQIKHVAAVNYIFGAAILSEKVPVDVGDESGPASLTTKADILKYLKNSLPYVL